MTKLSKEERILHFLGCPDSQLRALIVTTSADIQARQQFLSDCEAELAHRMQKDYLVVKS